MNRSLAFSLALIMAPLSGLAQTTDVAFSGLKQDTSLPVEVTSDSLRLDQNDGSAVFSGNVVVIQGDMRLAAPEVRVEYTPGETENREIQRLIATGGVTFVSAGEAAESRDAEYTVATGVVVMTGDVLLTQGPNTLASQRLVVNLNDGTGQMDGRVRTVFRPGKTGVPAAGGN